VTIGDDDDDDDDDTYASRLLFLIHPTNHSFIRAYYNQGYLSKSNGLDHSDAVSNRVGITNAVLLRFSWVGLIGPLLLCGMCIALEERRGGGREYAGGEGGARAAEAE